MRSKMVSATNGGGGGGNKQNKTDIDPFQNSTKILAMKLSR